MVIETLIETKLSWTEVLGRSLIQIGFVQMVKAFLLLIASPVFVSNFNMR